MLHFDRFHFETHMRIASFRRLIKKEKQIDHWVSIGRDFRNVSKWEGRAYFLSYIFFGRLFYFIFFFVSTAQVCSAFRERYLVGSMLNS